MELKDGIKTFQAKNRQQWRNWLLKNHDKEKSVWLIMHRKESGKPNVTYPEAVEEALCFGWIDSKANKRDDSSHFQYFAKRNPKSGWSKTNKERGERLIRDGLIHNAGMQMIVAAKENGNWNALDDIENIVVPPDMQKAFNKNKTALGYWNGFPPSVKKMILAWVLNAKRPETRKKRIEETIRLAAENKRANNPGKIVTYEILQR